MNILILDHIDQIQIDLDSPPINNIQSLDYSREGIIYLANYVKNQEENFKKSPIGEASFAFGSSHTGGLLPNFFHWFAVTSCSYARTVELMNLMSEKKWSTKDLITNKDVVKDLCDKYLKRVIPEVYEWRNKIAAHFAATDPRKDNAATLEFSLLSPISWRNSHYYAGTINWASEGSESTLPEWSLVEVFEQKFIPRYWPSIKIGKN